MILHDKEVPRKYAHICYLTNYRKCIQNFWVFLYFLSGGSNRVNRKTFDLKETAFSSIKFALVFIIATKVPRILNKQKKSFLSFKTEEQYGFQSLRGQSFDKVACLKIKTYWIKNENTCKKVEAHGQWLDGCDGHHPHNAPYPHLLSSLRQVWVVSRPVSQ